VHEHDDIDLLHRVERRLEDREIDGPAEVGHDSLDLSAAPAQPGSEIFAIQAGDDVEHLEPRLGEAGGDRLQRHDRFRLHEDDIVEASHHRADPIGQQRIADIGIGRGIEQVFGGELGHELGLVLAAGSGDLAFTCPEGEVWANSKQPC
jgi:hypothetical protein